MSDNESDSIKLNDSRKVSVDEYISEEVVANLIFSPSAVSNILSAISAKLTMSRADLSYAAPDMFSAVANAQVYPVMSVKFDTDSPVLVLFESFAVNAGTPAVFIGNTEITPTKTSVFGLSLFRLPTGEHLNLYSTTSGDKGIIFATGLIL